VLSLRSAKILIAQKFFISRIISSDETLHVVVHAYLENLRVEAVEDVTNLRSEATTMFCGRAAKDSPWELAVRAAQRVVEFLDIFCLQKQKSRSQPISCAALAALDRLQTLKVRLSHAAMSGERVNTFNLDRSAKALVRAVIAERRNDRYLYDLCISASSKLDTCVIQYSYVHEPNSGVQREMSQKLHAFDGSDTSSNNSSLVAGYTLCHRLCHISSLIPYSCPGGCTIGLNILIGVFSRSLTLATKLPTEGKVWQSYLLTDTLLMYHRYGDVDAMRYCAVIAGVLESACELVQSCGTELSEQVRMQLGNLPLLLWQQYVDTWSGTDTTVNECAVFAGLIVKVSVVQNYELRIFSIVTFHFFFFRGRNWLFCVRSNPNVNLA